MNEERTRNLSDSKPFEERVFARFDSIDVRLEKLESRRYDTKPIWERALKEILETRLEVGELKKQIGAVEKKTDAIETRLGTVAGEITGLRSDYAGLHNELVETQHDFKMKLTRRLDLVLTTLVDTRDGLRDADERLTQLESKLV
jgi:chromosome segregation ATPase